ncbi:hypothetical protein OUZ56_029790 [Daphnia magna]|uniref:Uncharacterized protein n=1 Tax=Daphnia magna TaxID=35525 RepID=A0ABR0B7Y2_9CRUS|nr:hypothetical protein OUZ56_029790 [Daphnia magna]
MSETEISEGEEGQFVPFIPAKWGQGGQQGGDLIAEVPDLLAEPRERSKVCDVVWLWKLTDCPSQLWVGAEPVFRYAISCEISHGVSK